jgi:hypothetical protein
MARVPERSAGGARADEIALNHIRPGLWPRAIPLAPLPEMILRAPGAVPPIVLPDALLMSTPPALLLEGEMPGLFGTGAIPLASVPMKLPCTRLFVAPLLAIRMPPPSSPEMTLPAPCVVPPIVLSEESWTSRPVPAVPTSRVRVASGPRKLPSIRLPHPVLITTGEESRLITSPRTVLLPAAIVSPSIALLPPFSSINRTALSPLGSVFLLEPG